MARNTALPDHWGLGLPSSVEPGGQGKPLLSKAADYPNVPYPHRPPRDDPARLLRPEAVKIKHFKTSPVTESRGNMQLGDPGYSYVLAEDATHQAFLAYPLPGRALEAQRAMLHKVKHRSFVELYFTFSHPVDDVPYSFAAQEVMYMSLTHLERCRDLSDVHLIAILKPVLQGLSFLHRNGLQHGRLCSSVVQLSYSGQVKIS